MTPSPTGMEMGLPVSVTSRPRFETFGAGHGDGPDPVVAEVLLHFEGQLHGLVLDFEFNGQRVVDARDCVRELHIHHRTDHLDDFAFIHTWFQILVRQNEASQPAPIWPPAISSSSVVMLPWRSLLYSRVRSLMRVLALSVAFFMATMRALCSLALAFSRTW